MEHDSGWMPVDYDPETERTLYVRRVGGKIQYREEIPKRVAQAILEDNQRKAQMFHDQGGWKNKHALKYGAVVAAVPLHIDAHFKTLSGFDPTKGGEYDKNKYNSLLDDIDFAKLRTGGGRLGKRKAFV